VIDFEFNGSLVSLSADDDRMLLWALCTDLAPTETKCGCGEGICDASAVVIDGGAHRSCRVALEQVIGAEVMTVEGVGKKDRLHPLQQAFIDHDAFQCGYCTSGMLMDAYVLLRNNPQLTSDKIIDSMEHILCRCGAHQRIADAIEQVSEQSEYRRESRYRRKNRSHRKERDPRGDQQKIVATDAHNDVNTDSYQNPPARRRVVARLDPVSAAYIERSVALSWKACATTPFYVTVAAREVPQ
jgi:aerobic-type carbon monoxide dehydrogenase small subunit (CoxS/CutS family)